MNRAAATALLGLTACHAAAGRPVAPAADRAAVRAAAPAAASAGPDARPGAEAPAARLYRLLAGTYDSAEQAARVPGSEFREIHLAICPVDAPALGPRVLYVEQAVAGALDRPYRQRLYVVEDAGPTAARSRVFELRAPADAVGLCARPARPAFTADQAEERAGCAVTLTVRAGEDALDGATDGRACASSLRGAAFATSEVRVEAGRLVSWDRGYDAAGAQVWGAQTGPYEFVRRPAP